jgi:hypothetical protein
MALILVPSLCVNFIALNKINENAKCSANLAKLFTINLACVQVGYFIGAIGGGAFVQVCCLWVKERECVCVWDKRDVPANLLKIETKIQF